jgi:hypothetical protein
MCTLSLLGTFAGSLIGAITSSNLTNYRLSQIEKKLDNYNDIITRLSIVEEKIKGVFNDEGHN